MAEWRKGSTKIIFFSSPWRASRISSVWLQGKQKSPCEIIATTTMDSRQRKICLGDVWFNSIVLLAYSLKCTILFWNIQKCCETNTVNFSMYWAKSFLHTDSLCYIFQFDIKAGCQCLLCFCGIYGASTQFRSYSAKDTLEVVNWTENKLVVVHVRNTHS